jgi:hypothetical protein
MAVKPKSHRKTGKASHLAGAPARSVAAKPDDATSIFVALLEAERWLFAAGEATGTGTDPVVVAAIGKIRRQVCEQLERLQPRAYLAFDNQPISRLQLGPASPWF